jgi:hypothetical protein
LGQAPAHPKRDHDKYQSVAADAGQTVAAEGASRWPGAAERWVVRVQNQWSEDVVIEADWLTSDDPFEMFCQVVRPMKSSRRKLDLFCIACVRLVWHLLDHPALKLPFEWLEIHPGERVRPRGGNMSELFQGPARVLYDWRYRRDLGLNTFAIHIAHDFWADFYDYAFDNLGKQSTYDLGVLREDPSIFLPAVMREIFGNPFRPAVFEPAWRMDTTVSLAHQVYESRDFTAMPILADALEEAGCDNEDMLNHCRVPGPHVRGCWVVDLVLGKE